MNKNKKMIIILSVFTIIFTIVGGTFAYFRWQTSLQQDTSVTFTVTSNFSCSVDGGGSIESSDVFLAPTDCTNSTYAIKRKVTTNSIINEQDKTVYMDLWLDVETLDTGLANSENFKWVFTKEENSCSEDNAVSYGTFEGLTDEDTIMLLDSKSYTNTTRDDTYYLYIWLDKAETSPSTMDQNFEFKLNGECNDKSFQTISYEKISNNYSCIVDGETVVVGNPIFTYTGECEVVDDGNENWKVRFLTSGDFTSTSDMLIDAFLVGGGGGGSSSAHSGSGGGGGAGGYTMTTFAKITKEISYDVVIGNGGTAGSTGESTIAFGAIANGGTGGTIGVGGTGGSGGGGLRSVNGGSNGSSSKGTGQGRTTCEFDEEGCSDELKYSGGGGIGGAWSPNVNGTGGIGGGGAGGPDGKTGSPGDTNTGGGGGGKGYNGGSGGKGGSGIVVIRNARNIDNIQKLPSIGFDFEYTGNYAIINDGDANWRIKFLTSGTFTSSMDLQIDAFLVGGGGGGSSSAHSGSGGGGGAGGKTTTSFVKIEKDVSYDVLIGIGGSASGGTGGSTTAFDAIANGGTGGTNGVGGSGGSGGGGLNSIHGGSNGSNSSGTGQGRTTCEFGESGCSNDLLYSGGGGIGGAWSPNVDGAGGIGGGGAGGPDGFSGASGATNTGGGGGGKGYNGGSGGQGGSGIVVIRNKR